MKAVKSLLAVAALNLALIPMQASASSQWQPSGPIKLQIGFGAGGSTDTLGRIIAADIEKNTQWDVVVENKPGGGGVAMFSKLYRAKPNGLTIGMGVNIPILMNLVLRGEKLPFKADSFDYLGTVTVAPLAIVAKADAPFDNFKELVAYSQKNKGALFGFDAKPQEMTIRAVNKQDGGNFKLVSHKSGNEVLKNILGGHVVAGYSAGSHIKYLKSGELKMLAVATANRQAYSPDTQSLIEQGYDYAVEPYFYLAAPKGLPAEAKEALAKAIDDAIRSPKATEMIVNTMFAEPTNLGPEKTLTKLVDGVDDIQKLINATK